MAGHLLSLDEVMDRLFDNRRVCAHLRCYLAHIGDGGWIFTPLPPICDWSLLGEVQELGGYSIQGRFPVPLLDELSVEHFLREPSADDKSLLCS